MRESRHPIACSEDFLPESCMLMCWNEDKVLNIASFLHPWIMNFMCTNLECRLDWNDIVLIVDRRRPPYTMHLRFVGCRQGSCSMRRARSVIHTTLRQLTPRRAMPMLTPRNAHAACLAQLRLHALRLIGTWPVSCMRATGCTDRYDHAGIGTLVRVAGCYHSWLLRDIYCYLWHCCCPTKESIRIVTMRMATNSWYFILLSWYFDIA